MGYEHGWNVHLSLPARRHTAILAVSGRCGHEFTECPPYGIGDCDGVRLNITDRWKQSHLRFHRSDIIVRSPMLLRARYAQKLGFFDETHFRLGEDDKDLCRRGHWLS